MKKLLTIALFFLTLTASAQTPAVQKAAKSVFTLTTYKADGTIKTTTHGVYFAEKGEGIAAFTPFVGAASAQIIDAAGKKADVTAIIGANEMYDICRFKLSATSGTPLLPASKVENKYWTASYSTKKPLLREINVASTENFLDKFTYFIFKEDINDDEDGCPILNSAGELVGLVARAKTSYAIHSTDANYYKELRASGFAAHDRALQQTSIRPALPDDLEQARLMLMMLDASADSLSLLNMVADFNSKFPGEIEGQTALARYNITHGNLRAASQAMEAAIKRANDKSEAYARYSELIYNQALYKPDTLANWTFAEAEANINSAIAISDQPAYRHHLARITFASGDYAKAFGLFENVSQTELESSEIYYEMAQCKAQMQENANDVLALLDKAVEKAPQPITAVSANYIYARGNWLENMGENKRALADYLLYDSLMQYNAAPEFYYQRYSLELKMRQYQQALGDIAHAAYLQPREVTYLAELASLNLRLGRYEDAVTSCDLSFNITRDYADIYVVRGVALAKLGRKEEAEADLLKAKELGDERAEDYIEKYCR